jgi:LPXTG-motif cell wall-anchored protein
VAAAYAALVLLAVPAVLWGADEAPTATTPATTPTTATTPAPAPEAAPAPASVPAPPPPSAPTPPPTAKAAAAAPAPAVAEAGPVAGAAASGGVSIQNFAFAPSSITVNAGDTVSWTNHDGVKHSSTADDGSWDTGLLARGQSGSHTFTQAGTYTYHCVPHPNMTATVVVRAASDTASGAGTSGSGSGTGSSGSTSSGTSAGTTSSTGTSLPNTGLQIGLLALGGLALVTAGALLRRRLPDG